IYHPDNNGQALLATETGVWATNTLKYENTEWAPTIDGMANVRVDMLQLRDGDDVVLAATHGRGMFTAEYNLDLYTGVNDQNEIDKIEIYPNPTSSVLNIVIKSQADLRIYDMSGKSVLNMKNVENHVTLDVSSYKTGSYVVNLDYKNGTSSRRIFLVN
ncbi:MAG: hypothetical protein C0595_00635, partial [Marinilabiliales bacterium]